MKKLLLFFLVLGIKQTYAQCNINLNLTNIVLCKGECKTLKASGMTSYTWMPSGANTSTVTVCPPIGTTVYTITGSDGTCSAVATVTARVNSTSSASLCCGISDSSNCTVNNGRIFGISISGGRTPYHYQWYSEGFALIGDTQITLNNVGTGKYSLYVLDGSACFSYAVYAITCSSNIIKLTNNKIIIERLSSEKQIIQLFDFSGRLVVNENVCGTTCIDVSPFDNGIYYLKINNSTNLTNKKLVIFR